MLKNKRNQLYKGTTGKCHQKKRAAEYRTSLTEVEGKDITGALHSDALRVFSPRKIQIMHKETLSGQTEVCQEQSGE